MTVHFDILGLGCVAVDDLLYVPAYPPADAKMQVRRRERQCGGLTGTALVAAARFGARCAFAGILGEDELSRCIFDGFTREGVNTEHVQRRAGARPIHSVIIVDETQQTRTIFYNLQDAYGAQADWPPAEVLQTMRVLFVDHFGVEGMTRAAHIARAAGVPVVGDFESNQMPQFPELLALTDHVILGEEFARLLTGAQHPGDAAVRLWTSDRQAVVITCGKQGAWYVGTADPNAACHQPAFAIQAVDTTGCGDVFHGVYAAGLAQGLDLSERVRYASAAAALKATRPGGQAGIPTRSVVKAFLRETGS